jgi:hypothetical protein
MSEVRDPDTDRPLPKPGRDLVHEFVVHNLNDEDHMDDHIREAMIRGIDARRELGTRKYGTPLMTFNGRDALTDAWEESIDLLAYITQMDMEDSDATSLLSEAKDIFMRLTNRRLNRGDRL